MDHPDSLKPVPQYYAVNDPLPTGLEFPGCKPVPLPCDEIETYDGRLEFWDARTETAWVCEPTSPCHDCWAAPGPAHRGSNRRKPSRPWCMRSPECGDRQSSATGPWTCWSVMHAAGGGGSCRRISRCICIRAVRTCRDRRPWWWVRTTSPTWFWRSTTARTCAAASSGCTSRGGFPRCGWRCPIDAHPAGHGDAWRG